VAGNRAVEVNWLAVVDAKDELLRRNVVEAGGYDA